MKKVLVKGDKAAIIIQHTEFSGRQFVDIRNFYKKTATDAEWLPTPKGINIPIDSLADVSEALASFIGTDPKEEPRKLYVVLLEKMGSAIPKLILTEDQVYESSKEVSKLATADVIGASKAYCYLLKAKPSDVVEAKARIRISNYGHKLVASFTNNKWVPVKAK